jgi:hypothetical protein
MTRMPMMMVKKLAASNGMLTREHTEPYRGPSTMAREGGVPANFC